MKRWLFVVLGVIVVCMGVFALLRAFAPPRSVPQASLLLVPHSLYKYELCIEAFAFAHARPDNPYKTDVTFRDPFRKVEDTIVPHLLDYDSLSKSVTFQVDLVIPGVATFHLPISHVQEADGISVILPDGENRLHQSAVPLFVVSAFGKGHVAVLDFTCQEQWEWKRVG